MELLIGYFLVILLHHLVSSGFVGILGNTFTSIINQHYIEDAVIVRNKLECTMFCVYNEYCEAFFYDTAAAEDSKCLLRKYTTNILYPLIIDTSLPSNKSVMFLQKHSEINGLVTAYIQGVRATANDPFLDEIKRPVTDAHWGNGGVGGPGNYMRFEKSWIETSTGTTRRAYICQLRLN